MVDYEFYKNDYKGSAIAEQEWPAAERDAAATLARYKRIYTVTAPADSVDAEKMAICEMAESIYSHAMAEAGAGGAVQSASIGTVSVSYAGAGTLDHSPAAQSKDLYRAARRWLDIYRGVG